MPINFHCFTVVAELKHLADNEWGNELIFPRLHRRGRIEANLKVDSLIGPPNFHGFTVVAELKHKITGTTCNATEHFHGFTVVAELKHGMSFGFGNERDRWYFHGFTVVAELKHAIVFNFNPAYDKISAASPSWPN